MQCVQSYLLLSVNPSRIHLDSPTTRTPVCVLQFPLGVGSALECCQPQRGHITKENPFQKLPNAKRSSASDRILFLFSFLRARNFYGLILCRSCVQCHTCCEFLYEASWLYLENTVSLMLSTTANSYNFSDYSSLKISESWVIGVVSMSYLGLNTLQSIIFFILASCILSLSMLIANYFKDSL